MKRSGHYISRTSLMASNSRLAQAAWELRQIEAHLDKIEAPRLDEDGGLLSVYGRVLLLRAAA